MKPLNEHETPETDADMMKVRIECEDSVISAWAEKNGDTVDVVDADFARLLEQRLAQWKDVAIRLAQYVEPEIWQGVDAHDALEDFNALFERETLAATKQP